MAVRDNKPHVKVECSEAQQEQWSKWAEPGGLSPHLPGGPTTRSAQADPTQTLSNNSSDLPILG